MESDSDGEALWNDNVESMALVQVVMNNNTVICNSIVARQQKQDVIILIEDILRPYQDYRHFSRKSKAIFRHDEQSLSCIQRDYFGIPGDLTTPIFKDRRFEMMFCLSRLRVQRIFEDVMQVNHPFYPSNVDGTGMIGASLEANVLLPLKTLHTEWHHMVRFLITFKCQSLEPENVVTNFLRSCSNLFMKNICVSPMNVTSRT
jgi:hypothetical protein